MFPVLAAYIYSIGYWTGKVYLSFANFFVVCEALTTDAVEVSVELKEPHLSKVALNSVKTFVMRSVAIRRHIDSDGLVVDTRSMNVLFVEFFVSYLAFCFVSHTTMYC